MAGSRRQPGAHPWLDLRDAVTDLVIDGLEDPGAAAALDALGAHAAAVRTGRSAPLAGEAGERLRQAGILGAGGDLAAEATRRLQYLSDRARMAAAARTGATGPQPPELAGLPPELRASAWLLRAGLYFEAHDQLEAHWVRAPGDLRELYQAIIQVAVACQHVVNGNRSGALSLLETALARLAPFGATHHGVDLEALRRGIRRAAAALAGGAPWDPDLVPPLRAAERG